MDLLNKFLSVTDRIWEQGNPSHCFGIAEILYNRAAQLEGDARRTMLQCARAWKARGEERIG